MQQQQQRHEANLSALSLEEAHAHVRQLEVCSKETELIIKERELEWASRKAVLAGLQMEHSKRQLHRRATWQLCIKQLMLLSSMHRSSTMSSSSRLAKPHCPEVSGLILLVPSSSCTNSKPTLAMPELMSLPYSRHQPRYV